MSRRDDRAAGKGRREPGKGGTEERPEGLTFGELLQVHGKRGWDLSSHEIQHRIKAAGSEFYRRRLIHREVDPILAGGCVFEATLREYRASHSGSAGDAVRKITPCGVTRQRTPRLRP